MKNFLAILFLAALTAISLPVYAQGTALPEHSLGKANAPITVNEYVSLTCSHCAAFYNDILPELEKKYVETGKVRFVLHPFALNGVDLKAFSLAQCMPEEQYFAFVKVLFQNQANWISAPDPEAVIAQYAMLGGLDGNKARECLNNTQLQDAIAAGVKDAQEKFNITSTPTFVINPGADKIDGATSASQFTARFDKLLAGKK